MQSPSNPTYEFIVSLTWYLNKAVYIWTLAEVGKETYWSRTSFSHSLKANSSQRASVQILTQKEKHEFMPCLSSQRKENWKGGIKCHEQYSVLGFLLSKGGPSKQVLSEVQVHWLIHWVNSWFKMPLGTIVIRNCHLQLMVMKDCNRGRSCKMFHLNNTSCSLMVAKKRNEDFPW